MTADLDIESGFFRVYFVFDVCDAIDLTKLASVGGVNVARAQLELRSHTAPNYIRFAVPPVAAQLPDVQIGEHTANARIKIYDYGTISLRYSIPFSGKWSDFVEMTKCLRQGKEAAELAEKTIKIIQSEIANAMEDQYPTPISENYYILNVQSFDSDMTVEKLITSHKSEVAALVLAESRKLSEEEETNALSGRYSFFEEDLVIVNWDAALIVDSPEDTEAAETIIEFANTQLVQYLTYDAKLDAELEAIYKLEPIKSAPRSIFERKNAEKRAQQLRYFLADVREISDRTNNSLKIIGDAFYARLYRGVAARLGLPAWQEQIDKKLDTISEIYQFVTDQAQHAQSEFIEMAIVGLIALEIVIGLMKH